MSFRKISIRVLIASFAYLVGFVIYRLVVHHNTPRWSELLPILAGYLLAMIATEWLMQRRTQKRAKRLESISR
jgi:hypothetical protein